MYFGMESVIFQLTPSETHSQRSQPQQQRLFCKLSNFVDVGWFVLVCHFSRFLASDFFESISR